MISGFGLCCGYYDRFKENRISLKAFYSKRYLKILPFFSLLIAMDIAATLVFQKSITVAALYEVFANLTLAYGFIPSHSFSVIGVGWTLGVIFGFYILFPYFVFLIWDKKRAWISFVISILMIVACENHFLINERPVDQSTIRWMCYFIGGGLIYLYRERIACVICKNAISGYILVVTGWCLVYLIPSCHTQTMLDSLINNIKLLSGFALMLCGALMPDSKLLSNAITKKISGISFEIYLCHMMIYRIVEKLGLLHLFASERCSFLFAILIVTFGAIAFALVFQWGERKLAAHRHGTAYGK